jgi:hypothetical protein
VLREFAVLFAAMLPVASVYIKPWHEGLFFWVTVFAAIVPARRVAPRWINAAGWTAMGTMVAVHIVWAAQSVAYDIRAPFTGSKAAAAYIRRHALERVYGAGVRCVEIQPYFSSNVFANAPGGTTFWDMTKPNVWRLDGGADYVVACSTAKDPAADAVRARGDYREIAQFRGGYSWKERYLIESTEFAIFARR